MVHVSYLRYNTDHMFLSVILTAVYIPPQAHTGAAAIQPSDIVTQAENYHPDSFVIVTGDFNKANPKTKRCPSSYTRSHVQLEMVELLTR